MGWEARFGSEEYKAEAFDYTREVKPRDGVAIDYRMRVRE